MSPAQSPPGSYSQVSLLGERGWVTCHWPGNVSSSFWRPRPQRRHPAGPICSEGSGSSFLGPESSGAGLLQLQGRKLGPAKFVLLGGPNRCVTFFTLPARSDILWPHGVLRASPWASAGAWAGLVTGQELGVAPGGAQLRSPGAMMALASLCLCGLWHVACALHCTGLAWWGGGPCRGQAW